MVSLSRWNTDSATMECVKGMYDRELYWWNETEKDRRVLQQQNTGLIIIDVQGKLATLVANSDETIQSVITYKL